MPRRSSHEQAPTVGGRFVFHHMIWRTQVLDVNKTSEQADPLSFILDEETVNWPVHEVGRNADFFDPKSARLLKAGSSIVSGLDPPALERPRHQVAPRDRLQADAEGLQADATSARCSASATASTSTSAAWKRTSSCNAYTVLQQHTKIISFEPHLHAPGQRMCLEAIWGYNIQTLNCVGYDHNWVARLRLHGRLRAAAAQGHHPPHHRVHGQLADEQERARPAQLAGLRATARWRTCSSTSACASRSPTSSSRRRWPSAASICSVTQERQRHRLPAVHTDAAGGDENSRSATAVKNDDLRLDIVDCVALAIVADSAPCTIACRIRRARTSRPHTKGGSRRATARSYFLFGYMNRNWEEEIDVPVGPENGFNLGGADQGQPTHFLPRRNRFVFSVKVPANFTEKDELDLDAHHARQDREGLRDAAARLRGRRCREGVGDRRARRRHEQS